MHDTREEILGHARELYLAEGLDGFSLREVARRVGVTAPALYRHFESRDALLVALVDEAYGTLLRHLQGALEGATAGERFRLAGEAYLEFALDEPRLYQVLYAASEIAGTRELPEGTAARACAIHQFWNDRVRECVDAGLLRGDVTAEEISVSLWAHAHGLVSLYLGRMLDEDQAGFRETYGASSRRVLRGLATADFAAAPGGTEGGGSARPPAGEGRPARGEPPDGAGNEDAETFGPGDA